MLRAIIIKECVFLIFGLRGDVETCFQGLQRCNLGWRGEEVENKELSSVICDPESCPQEKILLNRGT